jgi:hypothetical protein
MAEMKHKNEDPGKPGFPGSDATHNVNALVRTRSRVLDVTGTRGRFVQVIEVRTGSSLVQVGPDRTGRSLVDILEDALKGSRLVDLGEDVARRGLGRRAKQAKGNNRGGDEGFQGVLLMSLV